MKKDFTPEEINLLRRENEELDKELRLVKSVAYKVTKRFDEMLQGYEELMYAYEALKDEAAQVKADLKRYEVDEIGRMNGQPRNANTP